MEGPEHRITEGTRVWTHRKKFLIISKEMWGSSISFFRGKATRIWVLYKQTPTQWAWLDAVGAQSGSSVACSFWWPTYLMFSICLCSHCKRRKMENRFDSLPALITKWNIFFCNWKSRERALRSEKERKHLILSQSTFKSLSQIR